MDPVELYCQETEGWPYDGRKTTLVYDPPSFVLTSIRRHIDADGERDSVTRMSAEQALVWLRDAKVPTWEFARAIAPVLATAELVAREAEGSEIRRLSSVWLRRTITVEFEEEEESWDWLDATDVRARLSALGWPGDRVEAALAER